MADGGVFWCSLDPVRRKLDFYPVAMTERLEASMTAGSPECVLGADFFNATVHFHQGGPGAPHYQTTPGQQMGRGGFKQQGRVPASPTTPQPSGRPTSPNIRPILKNLRSFCSET